MADKIYPQSQLPIRKTKDLLPNVFQTPANNKFMAAVVDPLVQPGVLQKTAGYVGRRYGKTYRGSDIYLDTDNTLRSRYQVEPGVIFRENETIQNFYDYLDVKNQIKFFGNEVDRDYLTTSQEHYSWNPPIDWDKFINFREYYWQPSGPPPLQIYGQSAKITSTYKVELGLGSSWVFSPDGVTNNPKITLYRGQTYKFKINAPSEAFVIRTNPDLGSLVYNPNLGYKAGSVVLYNDQLWRAKVDVLPDGSTINVDSQDWELISINDYNSIFDYNDGIKNNKIENGTLTFTVPYDSPDVLFYQSVVNLDRQGQFVIQSIVENTYIDVTKDVLGKSQYKSSNGIEFTNGLVVEFMGKVSPEKYATDTWLVEGVGKAITLTRFSDLIVPVLSTDVPEVLFDNAPFDAEPFDDASAYPGQLDYITISKNSQDSNPWSRYNRWFHRSVLEYAYTQRGQDFPADENLRAKRPIIEFRSNIQLYNHCSIAKTQVDYIDTFTDDIFSKIEGSSGYNVDGEFLFEGARVLVVADTDSLANNKIYTVHFIKFGNNTQITLKEATDSQSVVGQGVLVRRGKSNSGLMYHFTGESWVKSQAKTTVNQSPLFDVYDENYVSFSDPETYPISSFNGNPLVSYKIGNGLTDSQLGFSLSYLNIDNVGDIQFNWDFGSETVNYTIDRQALSKKVAVGYFKDNSTGGYDNGWTLTDLTYIQPLIDSVTIQEATNTIKLTTIDWAQVTTEPVINFYLNGDKLTDNPWTRNKDTFTFQDSFSVNDIISVKIVTDLEPVTGYYEIPVGLERNPLNSPLTTFTYGQAIDHIVSAVEFDTEFQGNIPGKSNLRDLDGYQDNAKRFLTHSGLTPVAIALLCDKTNNIIKSLQYAKRSYTEWKSNFITKALEIEYNESIPDFVDDIINELSRTKNGDSPFSDSDMIGSGAYSTISYTVEDTGIKTFALSAPFSLTTLSRKAVYVYLNDNQLLHGRDYTFNDTFGFVNISLDLNENDLVEIREYVSTAHCFVPPTPTSLGLYKKYTPSKFLDDTYKTPTEVIQGHDGSITVAYGDFRDDLLLEIEYRIYNNIKQEYDHTIFDIDAVLGGYYGNAIFNKDDLDNIVEQEFLKWINNTNIDYTNNTYFTEYETFTYSYTNMTDPTGKQNLPGWWRGVYNWFYDTDRPHRCPWEILGFSQKPIWWEKYYGPAPYTSGNLILWEDIRDGIIREGDRAGTYLRYARPTILSHLPVDVEGKLLSPLESGLANDFVLINNRGPFKLGDISPVEYAWRSSSEFPFAITIALCLLKPFEFIGDSFDRSQVKLNNLGQTVNVNTNLPVTLNDIKIPKTGIQQGAGLVVYLIDYAKSRGVSLDLVENKIKNIDVNLTTRLGGFVDKAQQKYLLDSKNPKSTSTGVYIPAENYDIIFNVSAPISTISYSGVIIEKTLNGWYVTGYDDLHPYFPYYEPLASQGDPLISVGGVSETFSDWTLGTSYANGVIVRNNNTYYRSLITHTDSSADDLNNKTIWKKLPKLPLVGAVEAFKRRNFNFSAVSKMSYGTEINEIQDIVNFLLGYEAYLKSRGFVFENYDPDNQVSQDWTTSCKEFMFWTRHNWAIGSIITLSPASQKVYIKTPVGVADNLLDGFYDYQVLKSDGKPLQPQYINVDRQFQEITVETTNTTEGIYYIRLYYVLKEHVTVFSDKTVFSDIIYDKPTGYRQQRIKSLGFRTTDWYGDYTSPGFLFDNVDIAVWQPFVDYRLGDIVAYQQYYWVSQVNQEGSESFNTNLWTKLDTVPEKQLLSNFDYKIKQFDDYFNVESQGIGETQRELARHTVGYQSREYLQNLAEDPVTQFQLYQGFIREKGTINSVKKVFDKISRSSESALVLDEEWAFRVGRFGGVDQLKEYEIKIEKSEFPLNPQPLLFVNSIPSVSSDRYYRVIGSDFTISPTPYTTNINPLSLEAEPENTAGYVATSQVDFALYNADAILGIDISTVSEGAHFWLTFYSPDWTVWRFSEAANLKVVDAVKSGLTVTVTMNRRHGLTVGDIVGFRSIPNLTGFYKITEVSDMTISVTVTPAAQDPVIDGSTVTNVGLFTEVRFDTYDMVDPEKVALWKEGSTLWVDDNGSGLWEVIRKTKQYSFGEISEYGLTSPLRTGAAVFYDNRSKESIVGIPGSGYAVVYSDINGALTPKQILSPLIEFRTLSIGSFGQAITVSPDGQWLAIGVPLASGVKNTYLGPFSSTKSYALEDVVLYDDILWTPNKFVSPDGSTLTFNTEDWDRATNIEAYGEARGDGFSEQGMIVLYTRTSQGWDYYKTFASPRPAAGELFGSSIKMAKSGTSYSMIVSAPGSLDGIGRVYVYSHNGTGWEIGEILPSELALNNSLVQDRSTMAHGILNSDVEMLKIGDQYGSAIAMSYTGDIIAVGAPFSDGQVFDQYRGVWNSTTEYFEGEVVQYEGLYYKLAPDTSDSTYTNTGTNPTTLPWVSIGDSTMNPSGKVFVYKKESTGYRLVQTIGADNLSEYSDLSKVETINVGDQFGASLDLDWSGTTLVIASPLGDINLQNQGSAYVLRLTNNIFRVKQKLESFEDYPNEYFGQSICISGNTEKIVIGAKNTPYHESVTFFSKDEGTTTFDHGATRFSKDYGFAGAVYVFERKADVYFLAEKLSADLSSNESFGYSVYCTPDNILVGSPDYYSNVLNQKTGHVRLFKKLENVNSWEILSQRSLVVDIEKLKSISLYDDVNNKKIQDLDIIDPAKGKILNEAEQELTFKVPYDPAVYSIGTDLQTVIPSQEWTDHHVGKLWWNTSTAKWMYYEQGDTSYRVGNWSRQVPGSSIDVYEWVKTKLLPSEWAALADTNNGIANGISGQPLYPNDDVYSQRILYNASTGAATETYYYYWVKNKTILPTNVIGRNISASTVASYINNPIGSGTAFVGIAAENTLLLYNFKSIISTDYALLNIEYKKDTSSLNPVHNEYQLIREGSTQGVPSYKLETKWIDSLVGYDSVGNRVPDPGLPAKLRYGIEFRPRQGMFINRLTALRLTVDNLNAFLSTYPLTDSLDFTYLNLVDPAPNSQLNLYDVAVDTDIDLETVSTTRVEPAILQVNIINGQVDTIDIVSKGFGYKVVPPVIIDGDGELAAAEATIDSQGRIISVTVTTKGRKYSYASASIRPFSVLVNKDATANNFWGIYAYNSDKKTFYRTRTQAYDTTRYWSLQDWWLTGYSSVDRIVKEIPNISYLGFVTTYVGDMVRIKEYASGGWAVLLKTSEGSSNPSDDWMLVGREKGTVLLEPSLYDPTVGGIGYDNNKSYDTAFYDLENAKELRNILRAVKDNAYNLGFGDQWSSLFFVAVRYVLTEQKYVDWMFKTSLVTATHNVGAFEQKLNYKNDNLASFQDYINEVKPYRTTVREYISRYNTLETTGLSTSDFDLPPAYNVSEGKITSVTETQETIQRYPWKWWLDNHRYSITEIRLSNPGSEYNSPPTVIIDGDGTGATAKAYISNGSVSGVELLTAGSGYTRASIKLVGGNGNSTDIATAIPVLGDSKTRTFNLSLRFDRVNKESSYSTFTKTDTFVAEGNNAVFKLSYAPSNNKNKINILRNGNVVYKDEYSVKIYKEGIDNYSLLKGSVIFVSAPNKGDNIVITYEKNDELLYAVDRINKYYLTESSSPTASGMLGKELNQLMTGLDFGGVQVQGTTFEVTGGWDALPWFSDSWDSVESSNDIYFRADGSTASYTFDAPPAAGQIYNIYIKRNGDTQFIRIDDPYFNPAQDSSMQTNPHAEIPTFIGDGSTSVIMLTPYLSLNAGDTLVFRQIESDGSVTINDSNILDTKISGGTLAAMSGAYSTASGTAAEEIVLEGGKFISPEQVPAPEENVPGQVLDSLSIKVFNNTRSGATPLNHRTIYSDGITLTYKIGQKIIENSSLLVYINKIKKTETIDYSIDYKDQEITLNSLAPAGNIIEIISLGIGGHNLLDYQEFVADGDTSLFLTDANYTDTTSIFVTVNGIYKETAFVNSTGVVDSQNRTLVQFGIKPTLGDVISILVLGSENGNVLDGYGVVRINQQVFNYEGSTRTFSLNHSVTEDPKLVSQIGANFNNVLNASAASSMIVEVNGKALKGPDSVYFVYDGVTKDFVLGEDPYTGPGAVLTSNISVYINDELKTFIQDYVYDGTSKTITITKSLTKGDVIKIETNFISDYKIENNSLVLLDTISLVDGDTIGVTWFNEYTSMDLISDEYTGGKVQYRLSHSPISVSYVWVYKNGDRLSQDVDYYVDQDRSLIYLKNKTTEDDNIKILLFGSQIYRLPSGYEIYKDMLNVYHFKRYSQGMDVVLAKDLNYFDTSLEVTDSTELSDPIPSRNIPGIITINNERIEYLSKVGNVLSKLRRGSLGTSIATLHAKGSYVVDVGIKETVPYNETQDRTDFTSDGKSDDSTIGTAQTIGPLEFTPSKGTRSIWYKNTIPSDFGPCDQIEVFVGGRRLRKDPLQVFDETLGAEGSGKYKTLEAEFSVDGTTPYIRLTETVPANTLITVIRKLGRTWYDRGENTVTRGVTLLENTTPIARFIAEKTTKIPE